MSAHRRQLCLHQTLKRYLDKLAPAKTLSGLQAQLNGFCHYYNAIRPHRALGGRTPLQAYSARIKARPASQEPPEAHFRVRHDKVDPQGKVSQVESCGVTPRRLLHAACS